jgi:alkanesulfonate monooxygenase SsuD/methylene tetrahydromethanopterin reductase-like flavin-dependent oxidoreductase (luciferase family)
VVAALGHAGLPYRLIGQAADVGFVTPHTSAQARAIVAEIQAAHAEAGRGPETINIFGDLVVFLAPDANAAADRKARLDELAGAALTSDAAIFTGTPAQLADLLQEWQQAGLSGFRLRPGGIPADLQAITRDLVPELQRRGVFRTSYDAGPLRGRLGLGRPASRYAASGRS